MRNIKYLFLVFLISSSLFAQEKQKAFNEMVDGYVKGSIPLLTASELNKKLERKDQVFLLDAREKSEFDVSRLPSARWVGYNDFSVSRVKNISKNDQLVVYCSIGYRSEKIAEKLKKAGYKNIYNLYGGIFDWANSGYPVYDPNSKPTKRVHAYDKNWGIWLFNSEKVYE